MYSEKKHKEMVPASGIVTPGLTQACTNVIFIGARVKIMWKAKVNNQLLAVQLPSCGVKWPKWPQKRPQIFMAGACPSSTSRCVLYVH